MKKGSMQLSLLIIIAPFAARADVIQSVSNLKSGRIFVSVNQSTPQVDRKLLKYDLKKMTASPIPWPSDVDEEEIMGLVQLSDRLLLISQWTAGDGKNPHIYQFISKEKKWNQIGEIACVSFDTVEVSESRLLLHCEADPVRNTPEGSVGLSLTPATKESLKVVLPQSEGKAAGFSYRLAGPMFKWSALEILEPQKKSFSASDLLNKVSK